MKHNLSRPPPPPPTGAENIAVTNVTCVNVGNAFEVKSSPGRGGFVRNFSFTDSTIVGAQNAMQIMFTYGDHPLPPLTYNLSAVPILDGFNFARIRGSGISMVGKLSGAAGGDVAGVMINGVNIENIDVESIGGWECVNVTGQSSGTMIPPVDKTTCPQLSN
jgi:hypothetical protein